MSKLPIVVDDEIFFDRLTKAQVNAMDHVAFSGYATSVRPAEKTLQTLVDAGLIVQRKRVLPGRFPVTITEHDMLLPIQMAWCFHRDDREHANGGGE